MGAEPEDLQARVWQFMERTDGADGSERGAWYASIYHMLTEERAGMEGLHCTHHGESASSCATAALALALAADARACKAQELLPATAWLLGAMIEVAACGGCCGGARSAPRASPMAALSNSRPPPDAPRRGACR